MVKRSSDKKPNGRLQQYADYNRNLKCGYFRYNAVSMGSVM